MLDDVIQDLRLTVRSLGRRPGLTVVVIFTLGLGIGATTSIFSLVHATLFRPLPFVQSDRLAMLYLTRTTANSGTSNLRWSFPRLQMLWQTASSFENVASFTSARINVTGDGEPERFTAEVVSANYFPTLRVEALRGRTFLREEDRDPGAHPVALISSALWQNRFGASRSIVGMTIGVNSVPLTIVGVLPGEFHGLSDRADVWVPTAMAPLLTYEDYLTTPQNFINAVARLKTTGTMSQASEEMQILGARIDQMFPTRSTTPASFGATLLPLNVARIDPASRRSVLVLLGSVACVLLIACVNIAGLLLSRASSREREFAVRLALGASRARLVQLLLTESLLLSLLGGCLGVLCGVWGGELLSKLAPEIAATPRNDYAQIADFASPGMDMSVLCVALAVSIATGILCGILPALRASRPNLTTALKEGSRGSTQGLGSLRRLQSLPILIVAETALALVLLIVAGLLLQSFMRMEAVEPGFQPRNLITFWVNPPPSRYHPPDGPAVVEKILLRVSSVPGVASATVSRCTPYTGSCARTLLYVKDRPEPPPGTAPVVGRHYVGPDHFRTLGIPLLRGRPFTAADRAGRPPVVIINQTAAERFWPGEDPIGRRVWFASGTGFNTQEKAAEIVGIVGDVRYWPPEEAPGPDFYTCYLQFTYPDTMVLVRAEGDPSALIGALRAAVRSVDRDLPIYDIKSMSERAGDALARPRYHATILGIFAAAALLLAGLGIYGVVAYSVSVRTQEIGIRMALGAESRQVLGLVLGQSLRLTLIGIVAGIAGSLAATRYLSSLLYGVRATDATTMVLVSLILVVVSTLASLLPARRAARIQPIIALHHD